MFLFGLFFVAFRYLTFVTGAPQRWRSFFSFFFSFDARINSHGVKCTTFRKKTRVWGLPTHVTSGLYTWPVETRCIGLDWYQPLHRHAAIIPSWTSFSLTQPPFPKPILCCSIIINHSTKNNTNFEFFNYKFLGDLWNIDEFESRIILRIII